MILFYKAVMIPRSLLAVISSINAFIVMAERLLVRSATAPISSHFILTPPPEAYAPNHDSAERALAFPLQDMPSPESELRKRQHQKPSPSTISEHGSSDESATLTPASSVGESRGIEDYFKHCLVCYAEEIEVPRWPSTQDGWRRFFTKLPPRLSSNFPPEGPAQPKYDRGYHRIRHSKRKLHSAIHIVVNCTDE